MRFVLALIITLFACLAVLPAQALEPVDVGGDISAIDLTEVFELYPDAGPGLGITTAPDANGVVSRIEVRSDQTDGSGNWLAFALANPSSEQVDRLIVAPHHRLPGSGILQPDLGQARIVSITPSEGFALDRQDAAEADVFLVTLNPETVVTFVAELAADEVPQLTMWEPDAYKDTVNSTTLYNGIVLGIAGLLALFLTILFVVKGSAMFPATAILAWGVLAYVCVDFGFIGKIVSLVPGQLNTYRAITELAVSGGLVVFLWAYLNLNRWDKRASIVAFIWLAGLAAMVLFTPAAPELAAAVARVSMAAATVIGLCLILALALAGFDRAVLLVPTWLLISAWMAAAYLTATGQLDNDIIAPALGGGLVLIVLLISFTVMQHAFAGGVLMPGLVSDTERQALALVGSGDAVWDWDVDRDEVFVGAEAAKALGVSQDVLSGSPDKWVSLLHPQDRDRYSSCLDVILDHRRGRLDQDFRLRGKSGQYHWMNLRARPVIGTDGEVLRCVGTLSDVTEDRVAQQRMLQDAVNDNLTGLPNRELFMDRLETAISLARSGKDTRPSVFVIDLDRFHGINESVGLTVGDSILLTVTRRMTRLLKPHDTLSRLSGDRFALSLQSETEPERIAVFAEALKKALNAPVTFSKQEIVITASIGLATWSADQHGADDMLRDAELAMMQAKRVGGDRIEPFRPTFREHHKDDTNLEADLRRALERDEIELVYQPIIRLETKQIAGFEAMLRWDHPRRGMLDASEFVSVAEKCGLVGQLGLFAMKTAAQEASSWHRAFDVGTIFVSVGVPSRQLLRHELINDVKATLGENPMPRGTLKLELTESLIMENPEQSSRVLSEVKALGAGLSLDDFGTGYSSLAQLMRFPFDTIKIDRSFVTTQSETGRPAILRSLIGMAHDLGMEVVAEGAEDENDALELQQLGCEYAQGAMFGEPMSAAAVVRALKQDYKSKRAA